MNRVAADQNRISTKRSTPRYEAKIEAEAEIEDEAEFEACAVGENLTSSGSAPVSAKCSPTIKNRSSPTLSSVIGARNSFTCWE